MDAAQRRNDHAGYDFLHRLPCGGSKDAVLRQPVFHSQLCAGEKTENLCRLRKMDACPILGSITGSNPAALENLRQLRRMEQTGENSAGRIPFEIL